MHVKLNQQHLAKSLVIALPLVLAASLHAAPAAPKPNVVFILDSATGTIERGLPRADWLQKLKEAGVQGEPELVYPGRKGPRK